MLIAFPEVEEGIAYGCPIFKTKGKMIARLREDGKTIVVKIDQILRSSLLDGAPEIYFMEDHYVKHPLILINLTKVKADDLKYLVELAWRMTASKRALANYDKATQLTNKYD